MDFIEDIDEFLGMKDGAQDGKIKNRKRTLSEGTNEQAEPPKKVTTYNTSYFFSLSIVFLHHYVKSEPFQYYILPLQTLPSLYCSFFIKHKTKRK